MSDEPIVEYLRSRSQVRPPMDLAASIADAIEAVPQRRRSWFAPFVPAAAAVAAVGVVVVTAILIGRVPDAGPPPDGSLISASASPTHAATPAPTLSPTAAPMLLEPGDTVTIDAVDADGTWGSITLTRGEDAGGRSVFGGGFFLIHVFVDYEATRLPNPDDFGTSDWALRPTDPTAVHFFLIEPANIADTETGPGPQPALVQYPEAVEGASTPTEGWIIFEVPGREANLELELLYWPLGDEPGATIIVREPAPAPTPLPTATPAPGEATYVEQEDLPFPVVDSAEADTLFDTPDTCSNPVAGYTVTYPDDWYTNTEIGDWPPCTWFSPTFFNVGADPNDVPAEVAIVLVFDNVSYGYTSEPDITHSAQLEVDGFNAHRAELVGMTAPNGEYTAQPPTYFYTVYLGDQPAGEPTLRATTNFEGAADYELNKAVLDRIMALIEFDE